MHKLIVVLLLTAAGLSAQSRPEKDQSNSAAVTVGLTETADEPAPSAQQGSAVAAPEVQPGQAKWFKEKKPIWLRRVAGKVGTAVAAPFVVVAFLLVLVFNPNSLSF